MKTRELIEKLQKLIVEQPNAAEGDVALNIAWDDDNIQRNLEAVHYGKGGNVVRLCA